MLCNINNRALIRISGSDAKSFLQAQLSNDITLLNNNEIQISALCQHQGKILALFWVMKTGEDFLLSFPLDLLDSIKSRLQMYVIMSDVLIEDVTQKFSQIGIINEIKTDVYILSTKLSLKIILSENIIDETNKNEWIKACIDSKIPEVHLINSEKLVPQMLNLDINEIGVNFSKGCYPGQEVVARLHYLSEAKRRLFTFKSKYEIQVGDSLYCASSNTAKARGNRYKGSGIVVSSVKYNSVFYCLATLDTELLNSKITLNNEHGPILEKINNE